ncbi:hypothetical protein C810_01493 [Lachnospiraceae bacterium A2]|nr:hypothetical protein C810_01493 [Lachnospiraceae bacterium A2]
MSEQRVIIYISATKQTTTAKWHLEGMYPSDLWIAVLDDIADLIPFSGETKVSIRFGDRTKEAVFYYGNGMLIQVDSKELDFWVKKSEKESEEKSMLHNVTVKHEENKVLEEFWVMRATKTIGEGKYPIPYSESFKEKELDHEPTPQEIAQFLSDSKADFVSVVQNYRFANELPF